MAVPTAVGGQRHLTLESATFLESLGIGGPLGPSSCPHLWLSPLEGSLTVMVQWGQSIQAMGFW